MQRWEDRETASRRRRLDEVHRWINSVLALKAESAGPPWEPADRRRRAGFSREIVANEVYVKMEAQRIDSEIGTRPKLADHIARLCHILKHTNPQDLGAEPIQHEIETKCAEVLRVISDLKSELKL